MEAAAQTEAVRDVLARYAAGIDDEDWEGFRACFHPDVVFPGFGPEEIRGIDAWVSFVQKTLAPFRATQHLIGRPVVQVQGDRASVRTPLQAQHFPSERGEQVFTLWGVYRSELVKRGGVWALTRHALDVQKTSLWDG